MTRLRLQKLPDRTPVKLTILIQPELHRALGEYARAYEEAYGEAEAVSDLVPAILSAFLQTDRAFRARGAERRE